MAKKLSAKLRKEEMQRATEIIGEIRGLQATVPDSNRLWKRLEAEFGGPERFAEQAKKCYDECEPGSASKVRMMGLFLEIYSKVAEDAGHANPYAGLSNEEMEAVLKHFLAKHGEAIASKDEPETTEEGPRWTVRDPGTGGTDEGHAVPVYKEIDGGDPPF